MNNSQSNSKDTSIDGSSSSSSSFLKLLIALIKNKWALISVIWLFFIIIVAIFASELSPLDPNKNHIMERVSPPLTLDKKGEMKYLIGSDALGRDGLSRLIYGAQVSLLVGFTAVFIGGILGTLLGILAGYYGRLIDDIIMRLADIQLAFPFILLAILFLAVLGEGLINLIVVGVAQVIVMIMVIM